jgi:hypothetical protein
MWCKTSSILSLKELKEAVSVIDPQFKGNDQQDSR